MKGICSVPDGYYLKDNAGHVACWNAMQSFLVTGKVFSAWWYVHLVGEENVVVFLQDIANVLYINPVG